MKKRSFTLLMTAITVSATLLGTSPILAETKDDTATEDGDGGSHSAVKIFDFRR